MSDAPEIEKHASQPNPGEDTSTGEADEADEAGGIEPPQWHVLLRNPNRRAIVDQLARTPGLNKSQLADALDMYPNLVNFHLDRLAEHGLVVVKDSHRDRERLCFLAEDEDLWEDEDTRILYGRAPAREIGIYLAQNPGASTGEIAEAVDLSEVTVRHHLRTLQDYGVAEKVRTGRTVAYQPTGRLESWVETVGQAYPKPWTEERAEERDPLRDG